MVMKREGLGVEEEEGGILDGDRAEGGTKYGVAWREAVATAVRCHGRDSDTKNKKEKRKKVR